MRLKWSSPNRSIALANLANSRLLAAPDDPLFLQVKDLGMGAVRDNSTQADGAMEETTEHR